MSSFLPPNFHAITAHPVPLHSLGGHLGPGAGPSAGPASSDMPCLGHLMPSSTTPPPPPPGGTGKKKGGRGGAKSQRAPPLGPAHVKVEHPPTYTIQYQLPTQPVHPGGHSQVAFPGTVPNPLPPPPPISFPPAMASPPKSSPTTGSRSSPSTCQLCGKSYASAFVLERHVKSVHEKLREFPCAECDYRASTRAHLTKHVKSVHEKLRDFGCQMCAYSSSTKSCLDRHIKIVHYKEKLKCSFCSFEASQRYRMTNHIKSSHFGEKILFTCPLCEFGSESRRQCDQHKKECRKRLQQEPPPGHHMAMHSKHVEIIVKSE